MDVKQIKKSSVLSSDCPITNKRKVCPRKYRKRLVVSKSDTMAGCVTAAEDPSANTKIYCYSKKIGMVSAMGLQSGWMGESA